LLFLRLYGVNHSVFGWMDQGSESETGQKLHHCMKKLFAGGVGLLLLARSASAGLVFGDDFSSYSVGGLIGQGGWVITGTSVVNPVSVASFSGNNRVPLANNGQDVQAPFGPLTLNDGDHLFIGVTINVSAAQATGDYFMHVTPGPVGNSFDFFQRIFIKSSGAGFVLGYAETSGGAVASYGSGVLSFGVDHRVVLDYTRVAGALNDTASLIVDPTDLSVEGNNPIYVTKSWTSSTAETNVVATINLRQGSASAAATLVVDDLVVGTGYTDVSVVPEPSVVALTGLGGLGVVAWNRIRRRR
jgi:hypothetical protein